MADAAPQPTPAELAAKAAAQAALFEFLGAFVPFAEAAGGADYNEMSAVIGTLGVTLAPAQIEALGKNAPTGPKLKVPPQPYVWTPATHHAAPPAPGQAFTLDPSQGHEPRLSKEGVASHLYPSIIALLEQAAVTLPDVEALRVEVPGLPVDKVGTEWTAYTYKQYLEEVRRFAKALLAVGFEAFESVAICGFNHPAWFFAHVGAIAAGGMSAGTYTTNSPSACGFVAQDSHARVVAVDTAANLEKYASIRAELPNVKHCVIWGEDVPAAIKAAHGNWALTYAEFLALGESVDDATLAARTAGVQAKNCSSLIYTSGTTGNPKGVMMSHDSIVFSSAAALEFLEFQAPHRHIVSFLPMSHIAAQIIDCGFPLYMASKGIPATVHCARPDALKGTLGATLVAVRPTLFFGVPRVWEKFVEGIKAKSAAAPGPKTVQQLKGFAIRAGIAGSLARQAGGDGELPYGYGIAKKAVHDKVREALGLDRCELCLTGAAPIPRATLDFLSGVGIDVLEVYGMSETAGMGTLSRRRVFKFGSCGTPTVAMELKVEHQEGRDKPGEGEICFRGRHVMMGYLRNEAKTREAIDNDGWMHSGDIGRIDEATGSVYITGRIKELIITAGGENIAPVPVEARLKVLLPALSNVVMIGDRRKYNTMLVTLKARPNPDTGDFFDELVAEALAVNPAVTTVTQARADAAWQQYIQKGLDQYNEEATSNAQKVQKFIILPKDLSVPGDELTGTLKLKRNVVSEKYAAEIDAMYVD